MAVTVRDQRGRVRSSYDERALIAVVRGVVTTVDEHEPERVSQRQFDAARAGAGYPDAPTARAICMRLTNRDGNSMPWSEVLTLALADADPGRTLNLRGREAPADYMGTEHLVYGLRRATVYLGLKSDESMGPDLYEKARRELIALAARRGRKRQFAELLPTAGQIEGIVKAEQSAATDADAWNKALALAELPIRPDFVRSTGLPIHLAAHHFLEYNGLEAWPSKRDLKAFAKLAGFSLAQAERPLTEDLAMARAHREELGLRSPNKRKRPSRAPRPEIKAPADGIPGAPKLVPRV